MEQVFFWGWARGVAAAPRRGTTCRAPGGLAEAESRGPLCGERLLNGFEGKLTSSKWARLAKCSQDTAYRDILDLIERGALRKNPGGGRSTSYSLVVW